MHFHFVGLVQDICPRFLMPFLSHLMRIVSLLWHTNHLNVMGLLLAHFQLLQEPLNVLLPFLSILRVEIYRQGYQLLMLLVELCPCEHPHRPSMLGDVHESVVTLDYLD